MKTPRAKVLHWAPRILGILFALFLSLFGFDVFDEGVGFWAALLAFLIHQLPVLVLLIAVILAWRRQWIGAIGFFGFAVWYLLWFRGFEKSAYLIILVPAVLVGALFLADWLYRRNPAYH
jgi:hypothetical protein